MTVDVTADIVIERPAADVAAFAGDPSNAPTWYRRISSAEWQTEPPVGVGSRIRFRARFMGRELVYTYEVVQHVPGERMTMRTDEGPFPMNTVYTWHAVGQRVTHMTLRNHGDPAGFSKLTAPLMKFAMKRAMRQDLAALKALLESR